MLTSFIIPTLTLTVAYGLVGMAWVAVFQSTGVLNLSTGSFILIGPYFAVVLTASIGIGIVLAVPIALVAAAATGAACYQLLMRPMAGRPVLSGIIVTLGIFLTINSMVQLFAGGFFRPLPNPLRGQTVHVGDGRGVSVTTLVVIGCSLALMVAVLLLVNRSRLGLLMRATAENPLRAAQLGIPVHSTAMLGWAIAGLLAGAAGIGYAIQVYASPGLALLGFKGLAPALLGGFQSMGGTFLGAFLLAVIETSAVYVWGGSVREVVPFLVLFLILLVRPQGFFGTPHLLRV